MAAVADLLRRRAASTKSTLIYQLEGASEWLCDDPGQPTAVEKAAVALLGMMAEVQSLFVWPVRSDSRRPHPLSRRSGLHAFLWHVEVEHPTPSLPLLWWCQWRYSSHVHSRLPVRRPQASSPSVGALQSPAPCEAVRNGSTRG